MTENNPVRTPVTQSTGTTDNPQCSCCTPPQPLESPAAGSNLYTCPVTGDPKR